MRSSDTRLYALFPLLTLTTLFHLPAVDALTVDAAGDIEIRGNQRLVDDHALSFTRGDLATNTTPYAGEDLKYSGPFKWRCAEASGFNWLYLDSVDGTADAALAVRADGAVQLNLRGGHTDLVNGSLQVGGETVIGPSREVFMRASKTTYTQPTYWVGADTSDGSDSKRAFLAGGGELSGDRGAYVGVYGNEVAGDDAGDLILKAGDVAGGEIRAYGDLKVLEGGLAVAGSVTCDGGIEGSMLTTGGFGAHPAWTLTNKNGTSTRFINWTDGSFHIDQWQDRNIYLNYYGSGFVVVGGPGGGPDGSSNSDLWVNGSIRSIDQIEVEANDGEPVLSSFNTSATGAPEQLRISHSNGSVIIDNLRGDIGLDATTNITSGVFKVAGGLVVDANRWIYGSGLQLDGDSAIDPSGGRLNILQQVPGWTNSSNHPLIQWDWSSDWGDNILIASGGNTPINQQSYLSISDGSGLVFGLGSAWNAVDKDYTIAEKFRVARNGDVYIHGDIIQNGAVIHDHPDYVFEPDYELRDLTDVADFVTSHKHLPGIPSRADVEADGLNMSEMQRLHLEKIEELTLYAIQAERERDAALARVAVLEADQRRTAERLARIEALLAEPDAAAAVDSDR